MQGVPRFPPHWDLVPLCQPRRWSHYSPSPPSPPEVLPGARHDPPSPNQPEKHSSMPRQRTVRCDYGYPLQVSPERCQGGGRAEAGETPTGELPGSGKGDLSCKGRFGEPCKGTAKEVSLMLGGRWEEKIWAGRCPTGMGMLQHHERAGKPKLAPECAWKPRHVPYRHRRETTSGTRDVPVRIPPTRAPGMTLHPGTRVPPVLSPSAALLPSATPPKALPGVPLAVGGLTPSPEPALPSCGSPKTNPCFPERQILASDSGQHFSSSWPRISASNYRHKEPASAAGRPA